MGGFEDLAAAPDRLGAYRIEHLLGRGGMGEVYLAWDERLRRHVAIKRVRADREDGNSRRERASESRRARFRREAQAVARLNHPAIVQIFDVLGTADGDCLVFEHVAGDTLEARIAGGPLAVAEALGLARDVADGLAEAHDKGIVHRDLKAANVAITAAGRAKVLDFGVALAAGGENGAARSGARDADAIVGTPHAMSPEQAAGRPVDHRSDLFALGGLLYHMLAGRPPFRGDGRRSTLERILHDQPTPLRELRPEVPAEVAELVRRLLAKPPLERPSDTREVAAELARLAASLRKEAGEDLAAPFAPATAPTPPPADQRPTIYTADGELRPRSPVAAGDVASGVLRVLVVHGASGPVDRELVARYRGETLDGPRGNGGGAAGGRGAVLFRRSGDAVGYALAYQDGSGGPPSAAGVGVVLAEIDADGRLSDPVRDRAARLAELADAGQILLGRVVFDLARRAAVSGPLASPELRWLSHGSFACAGVDDPLEICEVGRDGRAPLRPPRESSGVRHLPAWADVASGWRPAAGQPVPRREGWELVDRIGEGGFGEVWLAVDPSGEKRAFKFCFETSRVRALKREVTLLRLLEGALGQRDDIARLHGWSFDRTPYFLEVEYSDGGSLPEWLAAHGEVPRETLLELVAEAADALAAAHSVGVLHKDVKPANVLVRHGDDGRPHAVLTDFGIGLLTDPGDLRAAGFTVLGFTETLTPSSSSAAGSGTAGYIAPELLAGEPASVRSDVYALGVVLYQVVVGDFSRTPAPGWRREVTDEVLREDLAVCFDVDPERRPASAQEVARRLRSLEERRRRRDEAAAMRRNLERARRRRRAATLFGALAAVVALVAAFFGQRAEEARRRAENLARATAASHLLARGQPRQGSLLLLEVRDPRSTPTAVDSLHDALAAPVETLIVRGHSHAVENAVWSPDGRHFATASHDGTARVWTARGEGVAVLRGPPADWVWRAEWSPDGERLLTAGFDHPPRIWDPFTGETLAVLDAENGSPPTARWSPDGGRVLVPLREGEARICDGRTGACPITLAASGRSGVDAAWSHDGSRVATAAGETARIWDASTGRPLAVLAGHESQIQRVAWSPDDRRVATGSNDATARVWDARTGDGLRVLEGHRGDVLDLDWGPEGRRLLTVSADSTARIWDLESDRPAVVLRGHGDAVWDGAWNAGGTRVVTNGDDKTARIWDPSTGAEVAGLRGHEGRVWSAAWSPDGRRILTASEDGTARVWRLAAGAAIASYEPSDVTSFKSADYQHLSWNVDGRIATASAAGAIVFWQPPKAEAAAVFPALDPHSSSAENSHFSFNWSPDGSRLLIGDYALGKTTLRAADGALLAVLDTPEVKTTSWSADGTRFSTASSEAIQVWETATGAPTLPAAELSSPKLNAAALSPDGSRIAVAGGPGTSGVREVASGAALFELDGHDVLVDAIAWSPDGRRIATGGRDRKARIYDVETGEVLRVLPHGDWVWDLAWSRDGSLLLTASADHAARIWDLESGAPRMTFRHPVRWVKRVQWSPDERRVATMAEDGELRFWAVPDDQPAYHQARLRARNRSCLEPSVYVENLGLSPREAERRNRACRSCVPPFFERVEGVPLWDWPAYQEAWAGYRTCFSKLAG